MHELRQIFIQRNAALLLQHHEKDFLTIQALNMHSCVVYMNKNCFMPCNNVCVIQYMRREIKSG